jgi:hypothetical protein
MSSFFNVVCEPYSFHITNTTALLGLCFSELFAQIIFIIIIFGFGVPRLIFTYRTRTSKVRENSNHHIFELVFSFISLALPIVDLISLLSLYYGGNKVK